MYLKRAKQVYLPSKEQIFFLQVRFEGICSVDIKNERARKK